MLSRLSPSTSTTKPSTMHRRLSTLMKSSGSRIETASVSDVGDDTESRISTVAPTVRGGEIQAGPPSLKVKRVDYYYSWWTRNWKYRNTGAKVAVEGPPIGATSKDGNDPWKDFLFVVVRQIPRQEAADITVKIVVKSPFILKACKDVIQSWPGISWNADPLEMDPEIFLVFYVQFIAYRDTLQTKKDPTQEEIYTAKAVDVLINSLASDYKSTLAKLQRLTSHGEIQWSLLPLILVPRTTFVARCAVTGQPRLFKLRQWVRNFVGTRRAFQLTFESVDMIDRPVTQSVAIGRVTTTISLQMMKGIVKIQTLDAYPIKFFSGEKGMKEQGLKEMAIERGKKWFSYFGIHHVQYDGVAVHHVDDKAVRHHVKSRIMVDRATFRRSDMDYEFPQPLPRTVETDADGNPNDGWTNSTLPPMSPQVIRDPYGRRTPPPPPSTLAIDSSGIIMESNKGPFEDISMEDYTDEDYLLASTVVYGFSLADKIWVELSVSLITPVEWNTGAFTNLVLPPGRKDLLKSLIEAHHKQLNFDDFIKGKGHGLVINLYGPPGVGKTFSAEATSEHVQRPLYIVGAGDLGTNAKTLDSALEKVFDLATAWKAIVLIDEADVFLEQRSLHDLERNAMVAVFLRHVEYYRGILFLTTNRVKTFDEAFLSRIHVALHFTELSLESKVQVWNAFLRKVNALSEEGTSGEITREQVVDLSRREINGRQIKNAVRTAQSLAAAKGQTLSYAHVLQTLDAMEQFTREFKRVGAA
ncbi:P-loop containing nucleoside triphosphate hydrolase protein [Macrolepiota fuliginosa MF-IS2]|uniref:P-loop containing nucleoside triphosphate hydrolase protein n=1 Tax=Macrolepiota fuliginosa MF-IS2 TaxID=1400762 RepID=A0A9P5XDY5_9AGAR|nr:P-loop containing nucleoside triphosphate hydrolase protein [Macrolepiota fuliginosa MF-IS2]